MARSLGAACLLTGLSLLGGMAGYHYFEKMDWIDAFANASMILSGIMMPYSTIGAVVSGMFISRPSGGRSNVIAVLRAISSTPM